MTNDIELKEPGSIENGVLFGNDGHLFLADGGHSVLDFCLGKREASSESLQTFAKNIASRHGLATKAGIPYLHIIFPDKQSVLSKSFPFANLICLGDVYLQSSPSIRDSVLYPRDTLRQAPGEVFQRTDTHLTDFGTATVAGCVLDRIFGRPHKTEIDEIYSRINMIKEGIGDLGSRFSPQLRETKQTFHNTKRLMWFHNNMTGGNNGLVDLIFNPEPLYDKRLLIFGDSFGRELARFLILFFKEVTFLRTPFFHKEMFDQVQPDVVITENVERYLSSCNDDSNRPPFMLYPFSRDIHFEPSKEFCEAFSAILSYPRKPYNDYILSLNPKS